MAYFISCIIFEGTFREIEGSFRKNEELA